MRRSKILATLLTASLVVASMPFNAFGASLVGTSSTPIGATVAGAGSIVPGLWFNVLVPTATDFSVNPMEFAVPDAVGVVTSTDQIVSFGYGVTNKSSVPLAIEVTPKIVSTTTTLTVVDSADAVEDDATTPTIYMNLLVPKVKVTASTENAANDKTTGVTFATTAAADFVNAGTITKTGNAMNFKADKSEYELNAGVLQLKASEKGDTIGFKFGGKVSKLTPWDGVNVSVELDFKFTPMQAYGDPTGPDTGYGMTSAGGSQTPSGISVTAGASTTGTFTTGTDLPIRVTGASTAKSVVLVSVANGNEVNLTLGSDYTISGDKKTVTIKGTNIFSGIAAGLKRTVKIKFDTGADASVVLTVAK